MEEVKSNGKYLRTILRAEVYDDLLSLAQSLSTGRGHWDFGVAIEHLLFTYKLLRKTAELDERVYLLENEDEKESTVSKQEDNPLGLIGKQFRRDENGNKHKKHS